MLHPTHAVIRLNCAVMPDWKQCPLVLLKSRKAMFIKHVYSNVSALLMTVLGCY